MKNSKLITFIGCLLLTVLFVLLVLLLVKGCENRKETWVDLTKDINDKE